ncbi:hypothetical protein SOVF_068690 [Spinacia oleracea]|uniref:aminocyclopropanecarboxylate oxidase n=1 Tax=Spinacia oleracea TaxID=3562 RepID=A0A9R0HYI9_SPIOL|nr:1-aminocyclopropane-1-carboxylate oxidase 1 [Spinacia oleracea]KNA18665.1 hypothetical protein SOVF_068690 [Spinacia oleracea]
MEMPTINFGELEGEKRSETLALLHHACENWGFFQIENHGIEKELMDKVKQFINKYYEENLKDGFFESDISKALENKENASSTDWESSFFIMHRPKSNMNDFGDFSEDFRNTMDSYIDQLVKVAEKLSELMCENLGLEKDHIKKSFSGTKGPAVGTKVAKYPECPNPELVRGLREHTDAGGIILLLQDDQVPGLEFYKDRKWFKIPPSKNNTIFINTGDQIEVLSNGRYKSVLHRVMTGKSGSRLSVATFYNPAGDAVISPAEKLLYPVSYRFQDYLKLYSSTKFSEKGGRFESMKEDMINGET